MVLLGFQSAAQDLISSTHVGDYFLQLAVMRLLLTCDIPWVDNEPSSISSPMFQINSVNVITGLISSFGADYAPLVLSL